MLNCRKHLFTLMIRPVRKFCRMKVACLLMQKNEGALLDTWIKYHGHLFGMANLFIFDNGSTDPVVKKLLADSSSKGVSVINSYQSKANFRQKGDIIGSFIKYLDKTNDFDFVMPLDCDEFVVVETDDLVVKCNVDSIIFELSKYQKSKHPLAIKGSYFNQPNASGDYFFYPEQKLFFRSKTFEWMDEGFHVGGTKESQEPEVTKICHIHYQNKPFEMAIRDAKEKLEGLVPDFEPETMRKYEGSGNHLKRFFVHSESEYENMQMAHRIAQPEFRKTLRELGLQIPFSNHWRPLSTVASQTPGKQELTYQYWPVFGIDPNG